MQLKKVVEMDYKRSMPVGSRLHSHTNCEIFYFHEGEGSYLINDKIYLLSPGDILLMNGITLHCPRMYKNADFVRTVIYYDAAFLRELPEYLFDSTIRKRLQEIKNCRIRLGGEKEKIEHLLKEMKAFGDKEDSTSQKRFILKFLDLLYCIQELNITETDEGMDDLSEKERNVQRVIEYIENNFMGEISMQRLEENLHLSKYYLSRIFHQITGLTVFDYLYRKRVNEAKILFLLQQDISVTDVCYQVGFRQPSHFSRIFKKYTGFAPDQFRRLDQKQKF